MSRFPILKEHTSFTIIHTIWIPLKKKKKLKILESEKEVLCGMVQVLTVAWEANGKSLSGQQLC